MKELSMQNILNLRPVEVSVIANKSECLKFYRNILKRKYTTQLRTLMNAEFDMGEFEMKIPEIRKQDPEEYKPMHQPLEEMQKAYETTMEALTYLQ